MQLIVTINYYHQLISLIKVELKKTDDFKHNNNGLRQSPTLRHFTLKLGRQSVVNEN